MLACLLCPALLPLAKFRVGSDLGRKGSHSSVIFGHSKAKKHDLYTFLTKTSQYDA